MIIVLLADGFEEIEALTPIDMLRRAGVTVKTVGIGGKIAVGSHGIPVVCDLLPDEVNLHDVSTAIFPGGMPGSLNLDASPFTDLVINELVSKGGRLAAICAAPLIFGRRGLLKGKKATCYPGFENELTGAVITNEDVVTDGFITTAKGMGVSLAFSKELISQIISTEKAEELSSAIMERKNDPTPSSGSDEVDLSKLFVSPLDFFAAVDNEDAEDEESCENSPYRFPPTNLLNDYSSNDSTDFNAEITLCAEKIIETLSSFGVNASIKNYTKGPRFIQYELVPEKGTKVSEIVSLTDDLTLSLAAESLRMLAPIPGKSAIGVEVPLSKYDKVGLKELLTETADDESGDPTLLIGKGIDGATVKVALRRMPHALIGGIEGMGQERFLSAALAGLLYRQAPESLRLLIIDTQNAFSAFEDIPHLIHPIITDAKTAVGAFAFLIEEMDKRYDLLRGEMVRNITDYNAKMKEEGREKDILPSILVLVNDFADIMEKQRDLAENQVMCLAQKARAAGLHLILNTAHPKINVFSGTIKANIPTRIAFKTLSYTDSRTVIDARGAEKLLAEGDTLVSLAGNSAPCRVQACTISDEELRSVVAYISERCPLRPNKKLIKRIQALADECTAKESTPSPEEEGGYLNDKKFLEAVEIALNSGKVSTALLQRKLSIGYGKAAKYLDIMEDLGLVSEGCGAKPRSSLISYEEWKEKLERYSF